MNEQFEEGEKAIVRESASEKKKTSQNKEKVDLKKMVIYSELLKPKFDEGLVK